MLGIGYAGYKTYRETQPAIANAATVSKAIEATTERLRKMDLREQEYQDQIEALTETVRALAKKQDAPGVKEALAALAEGQTEAAKAIFAKTVEANDRAEEMLKKALAIDEKLGRQEGMANAYGNLGIIYKTRGELDRAEKMYKKSLAIEEKLGRQQGMANAYAGLGLIYQTRGDLDRAEEMYKKSLAIEEKLGRQQGMASYYGNLGLIYQTRGELDRAEEMYRKAVALFKAVGVAPQVKQVQALLDSLSESRAER